MQLNWHYNIQMIKARTEKLLTLILYLPYTHCPEEFQLIYRIYK